MASTNQILFGTDEIEPARRILRAGRLQAELDRNGNLGNITFDGVEVLRGIAFLVRNKDWGTFAAELSGLQVQETADGFTVTYHAICRDGDNLLQCDSRIEGHGEGTLRFSAKMTPTADFITNRAGFIVLHGLQGIAGAPVDVEHNDGSRETVTLPRHVRSDQPLFDLAAVTHHPHPALAVTVRFHGDVFEMEDQRNWTDASFKTYVRPLSRPFPYTLTAGITVEQTVELQVRSMPTVQTVSSANSENALRVQSDRRLGVMPTIGVGVRGDNVQGALAVADHLRRLRVQTLVAEVDPRREGYEDTLVNYERLSVLTGAAVSLEMILPCVRPIDEELQLLADAIAKCRLKVEAIAISPAADLKTGSPHEGTLPPLSQIYEEGRKAFPTVRLGGGTFAYFAELNRKRPPVALLDFVTHTTCPIIHAADDDGVMQTLECLPWVFASTRAFIGDCAYHVGPISIGMRANPYGSTPTPNPNNQRLAMVGRDPRAQGLFGAAFYAAYAMEAARAQIQALSLCAPTGDTGLFVLSESAPRPVPAASVVQLLASAAGKPTVDVSVPRGLSAIAWQDEKVTQVLVANLTRNPIPLQLPESGNVIHAAIVDEARLARTPSDSFLFDEMTAVSGARITLAPYAVALIGLTNAGR
jgi:D-apionolactonase